MEKEIKTNLVKKNDFSFKARALKDLKRNKYIYLMLLPVLVYYIVFCYLPMFGVVIAFKNYNVTSGVLGSKWVGLKWFKKFITDYSFFRVLRNTLLISVENIAFGFPMPIIFALLINEIKNNAFKKSVQTITYLPHFISLVVFCGIVTQFLARDGVVTKFLMLFGVQSANLISVPKYFRAIYIGSGIWQEVGWGSIIYLSALTAIDPQLYEAAEIDGANKFRQIFSITLPGIAPTIIIMLILRVGQIMNVGYEKILLLYSPLTYETADVISTYLYRVGILEGMQFSYSTAIGLFNSVVNLILIVATNTISKKVNDVSLW